MTQVEPAKIMSRADKQAAVRADLEAWSRREGRKVALVCIGLFIGSIIWCWPVSPPHHSSWS